MNKIRADSIPSDFSDSRWKIDWKVYLLIIAILVALVTSYIVIANPLESEGEKPKSFFMKAKLEDKKISLEEETKIIPQVINPTENSYRKGEITIRLSTKAETIEMSNPNQENIEVVNGERRLMIPLGRGLGEGAQTGTYPIKIRGSLQPGRISATVELELSVIVKGEVKNSKRFEIKITRE